MQREYLKQILENQEQEEDTDEQQEDKEDQINEMLARSDDEYHFFKRMWVSFQVLEFQMFIPLIFSIASIEQNKNADDRIPE